MAVQKITKDLREQGRIFNVLRAQYLLAQRLLMELPDIQKAKVLDVGAGMGEFAVVLREKGFDVSCIDSVDRCYESLIKHGFESHKTDLEE